MDPTDMANYRAPWTDDADNELIRLRTSGMTKRQIANRMGRSLESIDNRLDKLRDRLGERKDDRRTIEWTDEKDARLRELWRLGRNGKEMAADIGEPHWAVLDRCKVLNLPLRRQVMLQEREAQNSPPMPKQASLAEALGIQVMSRGSVSLPRVRVLEDVAQC